MLLLYVPEEELSKLEEVDLVGKFALIKAVLFSISWRYPYIPLMNAKTSVEKALRFFTTIFKSSGFYQGLIGFGMRFPFLINKLFGLQRTHLRFLIWIPKMLQNFV